MFEIIKNLKCAENEKYCANAVKYIINGWESDKDAGLKAHSTDTRWNQYKAGTISRDTAIDYAIKRVNKQYQKRIEKAMESLDALENIPGIDCVVMSVTWAKNPYWGNNPTCNATVHYDNGYKETFVGHASGCGYDKLSAAIANALNDCKAVTKLLCTAKENAITAGIVNGNEHSNANAIAYGAGYGAIPYLEGGTGYSAIANVFKACGLAETVCDRTHKCIDTFIFQKEG